MVLDTSALIAVLLAEPERDEFADAIAEAPVRLVSSVSVFECSIVLLSRKGPSGLLELDRLLAAADVEIKDFTEEHLRLARDAYHRFGKGRHPAKLNLGDCCSYALAMGTGEPLLYKGNDFGKTDVPAALTLR